MKHRQKSWWIVGLLCVTATAGYIVRVNVSTAGPLLMSEFHLSQIEMGRIFSAFLLGYALFQIPAGALADRWGARRVLTVAVWLWVAVTIALSFVGWGPFETTAYRALTAFMVIRFLLGITESPTYPGSAQGVSRWVLPRYQGRANGIVIASIGLGSAIAPPLVSNIMVHWGWRPALLISSAPAMITALIWLRIREPQTAVPEKTEIKVNPQETNGRRLNNPGFYLLTISYTLQGYVGYIFVTWFYIYLVQERHFDFISGAWMSSLPWVLSVVSIPLGGYISDRLAAGKAGPVWGRRIIPVTGMMLSGVMIAIGAHTSSSVMAALTLALATALILCVEGPFWAMMMRIAGQRSGTAGGIMNMGSNLGGLVSPMLTPIIASRIGWEKALQVAAILAIMGSLLWLWIKPSDEINAPVSDP
jgi:ACS family glucarate transporter-like MFS transporter